MIALAPCFSRSVCPSLNDLPPFFNYRELEGVNTPTESPVLARVFAVLGVDRIFGRPEEGRSDTSTHVRLRCPIPSRTGVARAIFRVWMVQICGVSMVFGWCGVELSLVLCVWLLIEIP